MDLAISYLRMSAQQTKATYNDINFKDNASLIHQKMKMLKFLAACLLLFVVSACDSEIERDATKMAESTIELKQLRERSKNRSNLNGKPVSRQELSQYEQQHIKLFNQMSEKYGHSRDEWKEFQKLVNEKIKEAE